MNAEKEISIWVKALLTVLEGKNKEEKKSIFKELVGNLKKRKKEYLLPKIFKSFEKNYLSRKRIELFFAREQSADLIKGLKERLFEIFGKDKNINVNIEESLIGGFRVKTANFLIKASVKDFLNELKSKTINE